MNIVVWEIDGSENNYNFHELNLKSPKCFLVGNDLRKEKKKIKRKMRRKRNIM